MGAVGAERCARVRDAERARRVCRNLPGAGLRIGKGAVSLGESFTAGCSRLPVGRYVMEWGFWVRTHVSTWSRMSEHVLV